MVDGSEAATRSVAGDDEGAIVMMIEMFRDGQGWRWRLRAKVDNRELAVSTDSFGQRLNCVDAIRAMKIGVPAAPVFDVSQGPPVFVAV
jgi:uncharacterized protein YegP (UPF0339 family)